VIPDALPPLIRRFEGLRLKPYLCPAGVPTIGYGHTGPRVRMESPPITRALAEDWLLEDAEKACRAALRWSPILAGEDDKLAAIADFVFNLGAGRYRSSTLRRRVNEGDWTGAEEQLQRWVFGGGKRLPGLVTRRAAEGRLLLASAPVPA
jgi:lysozyme